VSGGGSGNSSSSESGSLGILINLSNLNHPIIPPSTTTASASFPLMGNSFDESVGPTTPRHLQLKQWISLNFDDELFKHIVGV